MNAKRIAPLVTVLAILVACQDQPTALNDIDDLEPQLINTDEGNWVLLFSFPLTDALYAPCANDGQGETLEAFGTAYLWGKDHTPPANGNSVANTKMTFSEDTGWWGSDSGDLLMLVNMNENVHQITKQSDGVTYWSGSLHEVYENQDGERLHLTTVFWLEDFVIVDSKTSCGPGK